MPETVVHFQVRMPPTLHARLSEWAKDEKQSLNALIVRILESSVDAYEKTPHPKSTIAQ